MTGTKTRARNRRGEGGRLRTDIIRAAAELLDGGDAAITLREVARRVDAVALFGKPNARFLSLIGQPVVPVGSAFVSKTIDQCAVNDPICSGGIDFAAHNAYPANGMVAQAASFAAARV